MDRASARSLQSRRQFMHAAGAFGLGPHFAPDGDALRLQYLAVELDPARLQVASPFARELLAYVARERARVGGQGSGDGDRGLGAGGQGPGVSERGPTHHPLPC
jgi:hypothetical protein